MKENNYIRILQTNRILERQIMCHKNHKIKEGSGGYRAGTIRSIQELQEFNYPKLIVTSRYQLIDEIYDKDILI